VQQNIISEAEKSMIWFDNVVDWLCGDNKDAFIKRLGISVKE